MEKPVRFVKSELAMLAYAAALIAAVVVAGRWAGRDDVGAEGSRSSHPDCAACGQIGKVDEILKSPEAEAFIMSNAVP